MNPYLFYALDASPRLIESEIIALPEDQYDMRPDPDRFTPREAVAHLLDWEPILRMRIESTVQTPGQAIGVYDESERAVQQAYDTWDPLESASKWRRERQATIEYLKILEREDWLKPASHPEHGIMTVTDMASFLTCHDLYHVEQFFTLFRRDAS